MIDWLSLGLGTAWISGLGIVLATISLANYRAGESRTGFLKALCLPAIQCAFAIGMMLFCVGMLGYGPAAWQRVIFAVFALALGVYALRAHHKAKTGE